MTPPVEPKKPDSPTPGSPSPKSPTNDPPPVQLTEEQKAIKEFKEREELYLNTIREQGGELTRMNTRLAEVESRVASPPAPVTTPEERAKIFYQDPQKAIDEAIEKAISPLKDFVKGFKSETAYDRLRNKFAADPRFKSTFEQFGPQIDEAMAVNEPTEKNMLGVVVGIVGAASMGILKGAPVPDNKPTNQPTDTTVNTPPHLRPSPAAPPIPRDDKPTQRKLTENERRLARERGMSEEDYLAWVDLPKEEVVSSQIGRKK